MRLDATDIRYIGNDEFRVLTAVRYSFPDPVESLAYDLKDRDGLEEP